MYMFITPLTITSSFNILISNIKISVTVITSRTIILCSSKTPIIFSPRYFYLLNNFISSIICLYLEVTLLLTMNVYHDYHVTLWVILPIVNKHDLIDDCIDSYCLSYTTGVWSAILSIDLCYQYLVVVFIELISSKLC